MENELKCRVCYRKATSARIIAEMSDGRTPYALCDECRPMVVTFFHVYGNLSLAVQEARQTVQGS